MVRQSIPLIACITEQQVVFCDDSAFVPMWATLKRSVAGVALVHNLAVHFSSSNVSAEGLPVERSGTGNTLQRVVRNSCPLPEDSVE